MTCGGGAAARVAGGSPYDRRVPWPHRHRVAGAQQFAAARSARRSTGVSRRRSNLRTISMWMLPGSRSGPARCSIQRAGCRDRLHRPPVGAIFRQAARLWTGSRFDTNPGSRQILTCQCFNRRSSQHNAYSLPELGWSQSRSPDPAHTRVGRELEQVDFLFGGMKWHHHRSPCASVHEHLALSRDRTPLQLGHACLVRPFRRSRAYPGFVFASEYVD